VLTFEQIKELIELVRERQLLGVEIERSGFRLKIDGRPAEAVTVVAGDIKPEARTAVSPGPPAVTSTGGSDAQAVEEAAAVAEAELAGVHVLRSPIVGTFYTSPSPDAEPYVRAGDRVKRGQVLCIVEAMKLMNEIESDEDGVIEKAFPKNAQPVEFGEPLFAIVPD
jgi:acetyl-CoA carboxylase biotin carboxyl carrier protein